MLSAARFNRRQLVAGLLGTAGAAALLISVRADSLRRKFRPRYILASCMYGYTELAEIVPEVRKTGATAIDVWPRVHGNQREQLDEMGEAKFLELLGNYGVSLGCLTQYQLGPFGLQQEMQLAQRMGCRTIVTGSRGPQGLKGGELKKAVQEFIEKMKPHLERAEATGVTVAIENHGHSLVDSPDSMKWLAEMRPSEHLGIAFAPYHLPQDEKVLADLIHALGESVAMFYAWQHGMGCREKLPKQQELLQMPGRGSLDFTPLLATLRDVDYQGWTEIFMHPVPRGVPILDSTSAVTAEINRSRKYLETCLARA